MVGTHRSSTLAVARGKIKVTLGMVGTHRSSTLLWALSHRANRWGWSGLTAQVHYGI